MLFTVQWRSFDFSRRRFSYSTITVYGYSGSTVFVRHLTNKLYLATFAKRHRKGKRNFSFLSNSQFLYCLAFSHALSKLVKFIFPLPYMSYIASSRKKQDRPPALANFLSFFFQDELSYAMYIYEVYMRLYLNVKQYI